VYTFVYRLSMRVDPLTIRETREQLSQVLQRFRHGDREPVFVGSRRHTEAVVLPVQVYDELLAAHERAVRAQAVANATGSLRAEGLQASQAAESISARWAAGDISTAEMRGQIRALHGVPEPAGDTPAGGYATIG
jgi:PHD/YefM family antitoxin component YafN of YafNO toxin-antitoxin module